MRTSRLSRPRWTIRLRLTLTYGGLFLLVGIVLISITYALTRHATSQYAVIGHQSGGAPTAPQFRGHQPPTPAQLAHLPATEAQLATQLRANAEQQRASDLDQLLTQSGIALAIATAVALALGWWVAGRALRPLRAVSAAAQQITQHSLHQRLALVGPDDEVKDLADTIDDLLARLEAAFEAQRRFVANASHELRTPITLDRTLIEVAMAEPDPSPAALRETLGELLTSSEDKERLIEALLTLATSERGLDRRDRFELSTVVEEALAQHQPAADERGIDVVSHLSPAEVQGNRELVKRLVSNLVSNAIRHNLENGELAISTGTRPTGAWLTVRNTGPVVPAADVERLLEPFTRLDASRPSHDRGHGLGLSIVAAVAQAHGARIEVDARHPDGGLGVTVAFPPT